VPETGRTFAEVKAINLKKLPIPRITEDNIASSQSVTNDIMEKVSSQEIDSRYMGSVVDQLIPEYDNENSSTFYHLLLELSDFMTYLKQDRSALNLNLLDYLGTYADGQKLADLYQPPAGLTDSMLSATAAEYEKLKLGRVTVEDSGPQPVLFATARYKPKDPEQFETDRWGYIETDPLPAMEFIGLSEQERALIEAFVPYAIEEGGGFANFRENATKNNSLVDRLEALTLPALDDVADGLERYRETKARAEELDEKIAKTDELIDRIVYELYGLTDEEIEIVEEAVSR